MSDIPFGFCGCGCGERTQLATRTKRSRGIVKGQPRRFVNGHQRRGKRRVEPVRRVRAVDPEYERERLAWHEREAVRRAEIHARVQARLHEHPTMRERILAMSPWEVAA